MNEFQSMDSGAANLKNTYPATDAMSEAIKRRKKKIKGSEVEENLEEQLEREKGE